MANNTQVIAMLAALPIVTLTFAIVFWSESPAVSSIFGWMSVVLLAAPAVAGVIVLVDPG